MHYQTIAPSGIPRAVSPPIQSQRRPRRPSIICRATSYNTPADLPDPSTCLSLLTSLSNGADFSDPTPAAIITYLQSTGCTPAAFVEAAQELPADGEMITSLSATLSGPLAYEVYLAQFAVAAIVAAAVVTWQGRPKGWARGDLLEVRGSSVAGKGLFASQDIPRDTVLGAYPGVLRTPEEMVTKIEGGALTAGSYVFQTDNGLFLDPTDLYGQPSAYPAPGGLWPFPVDERLAYANEPPKGTQGPNCTVEGGAGPEDMLFVTSRDVVSGEEVFIDYGVFYNRSGYRKPE